MRLFEEKNYNINIKKTHVHVRVPRIGKFDIFYAWFGKDNKLGVSYGLHGPDFHYMPGCLDVKWRSLWSDNTKVPVPAYAEEMLLALYGAQWTSPDPGFSHASATRRQDEAYLLTESELEQLSTR